MSNTARFFARHTSRLCIQLAENGEPPACAARAGDESLFVTFNNRSRRVRCNTGCVDSYNTDNTPQLDYLHGNLKCNPPSLHRTPCSTRWIWLKRQTNWSLSRILSKRAKLRGTLNERSLSRNLFLTSFLPFYLLFFPCEIAKD